MTQHESRQVQAGAAVAFSVTVVDWRAAEPELTAVRTQVFVREQCVPVELELDGDDPDCTHVLARSPSGEAIGAGRLMRDGRIGRMAVLASWRGRGVGAAVLEALLEEARRGGLPVPYLHAQAHAIAFYARYGFVAEGEEYLEAGIPHRLMRFRPST